MSQACRFVVFPFGLQYDPTTGTCTYNWKTPKAFAGTCQVFTLALNDGTTHTADFRFS